MDFTGKIALAPMAGICDLPFRLLCKEMGCDIVYTEMVSAKGMYYNNKNTGPLLMTKPEEAPIGVQIFGSEPELMASQAKRLEDKGFSFIDVNMGCPVPKIVNNGEGSALMKQPELIGDIVDALVRFRFQLRSRSGQALMQSISMRWRWHGSRSRQAFLQSRCMEEQENSIITDRQTGM